MPSCRQYSTSRPPHRDGRAGRRAYRWVRELGSQRAGRLLDNEAGDDEDVESDAVARDVGIDGAGASAEEAAMHVIEDDPESWSGGHR